MINNITLANNFSPKQSDKFFIDTNVWLYLFFPQYAEKPSKYITTYSELFNKIVQKNCLILNNYQVFSEFVNAWLQMCHKQIKKDPKKSELNDYKQYRSSSEFSLEMDRVSVVIKKMLSISEVLSGELNTDQLKKLIAKVNVADLNDLFFIDFCKRHKLKLITHDFDFKALEETKDIEIISANSNYFI